MDVMLTFCVVLWLYDRGTVVKAFVCVQSLCTTQQIQSLSNIGHLPRLMHLSVRRNMIENVKEPLQLPQLKSLDLSNNFLRKIDAFVFEKLSALKSLDLCDNPFESLLDVSAFCLTTANI